MKQTVQFGKKTIRFDFGLVFILLILFFTSIFALYNSFNLISQGSGSYYMQRQIMWYCIGFFIMFLVSRTQNRFIFRYLKPAWQFLMVILVYLLLSKFLDKFTGHTLPLAYNVNGAYSWLQIPFLGSFQASEFMKIVLIIKTSQIITNYQRKHPNPSVKEDLQMFLEIGKWAVPPLILIFLEPDTGVFLIIAFTLIILILCSGVRKSYIWILLILIVMVFAGFFWLYFCERGFLENFIDGYKLNRIDAWLNPEENILGSSNQLYTALLSLGSAGLTGYGLQANIISIPEAHTDFIFAAFGQCFGLLGTLFILIVCLCLDLYICRLAYNSRFQTNRLIMVGTIAMLLYQQFQNMGMIVGLIPITGITLPLISYGGSSTLSYFILFGVILNASPVRSGIRRIQFAPKLQRKLRKHIRRQMKKAGKPQ